MIIYLFRFNLHPQTKILLIFIFTWGSRNEETWKEANVSETMNLTQ